MSYKLYVVWGEMSWGELSRGEKSGHRSCYWMAPSSSGTMTIHILPFRKKIIASQNDACVDLSCYRIYLRKFLRRFAKPYLASLSSWAQRANYGLFHWCMYPLKIFGDYIIVATFDGSKQ